jgi:hypothetical protein
VIPTLRNQPNVTPSAWRLSGVTSSAIFNPGENSISTGMGIVGSFSAASARPTKPSGSARTAGTTKRKKVRALMRQILTEGMARVSGPSCLCAFECNTSGLLVMSSAAGESVLRALHQSCINQR